MHRASHARGRDDPGSVGKRLHRRDVEIAPDVTIESTVLARQHAHRPRHCHQSGRPDHRLDHRRAIGRVGERGRDLEDRQRRKSRAVRPSSAVCSVGDGAELGNYAEQKNAQLRRPRQATSLQLPGRRRDRRRREYRRRNDHRQLRRRAKHHTIIGDRAFIGSDTTLRAPMTVGEGAYTGAGSSSPRTCHPASSPSGARTHPRTAAARGGERAYARPPWKS